MVQELAKHTVVMVTLGQDVVAHLYAHPLAKMEERVLHQTYAPTQATFREADRSSDREGQVQVKPH
jgi:hypothetical protein